MEQSVTELTVPSEDLKTLELGKGKFQFGSKLIRAVFNFSVLWNTISLSIL